MNLEEQILQFLPIILLWVGSFLIAFMDNLKQDYDITLGDIIDLILFAPFIAFMILILSGDSIKVKKGKKGDRPMNY